MQKITHRAILCAGNCCAEYFESYSKKAAKKVLAAFSSKEGSPLNAWGVRKTYARFNSRTYLEVYDDIQAKSLKLYKDEAAAHEQTREKLKNLEEKSADERQKKEEEIEALKEHIATLEQNERTREEQQLNRKANTIGTIATIILAGIPYIALSVAIEFFKTRLSIETIWKWIIGIAGAIIATLIVGILFSKVQKWCFGKARFVLEKHR